MVGGRTGLACELTTDLATRLIWSAAGFVLLANHHVDKLSAVDVAIVIDIRFADHFVSLFVSELLAQFGHDLG